ncbi:MAG TPA: neutral zinc metallopeptidase [Steroidobacteraceae bacterium]|nr:neutral zinc metallopeptidase [Steroidobacteraceae bacterium]
MQRQAQGYVNPDSFTHGTSEQRVRWFKRGYQSGTLKDCDTFSQQEL